MSIKILREAIKGLAARGKTKKAVKTLIENLDMESEYYEDALTLKKRLKKLAEKYETGRIDFEEFQQEFNEITNSIVDLANNIQSADLKADGGGLHPSGNAPTRQTVNFNDFIIGKWRCTEPLNNFEMRISWNNSEKRYEGVLTKLGIGAAYVGFNIGEAFYFAYPTDENGIVREEYYLRRGLISFSVSKEWRETYCNILNWPSKNKAVIAEVLMERLG